MQKYTVRTQLIILVAHLHIKLLMILLHGTFKGRGFQFRITLETSDIAQNMNLQQAGYFATMPSRTEQSSVIASGAGAKAVTFTAPFFVGTSGLGNLNNFLPSVNITPQNMATGDFF